MVHHHYSIRHSDFAYMFAISSEYYTSMSFCCYPPFVSALRMPFSISCKAGLMVVNFFSFCLFGKIFISSLFLKDSITRYRILGWHFFLSIFWKAVPWCWAGLQAGLQVGCWLYSGVGQVCLLGSLVVRGSQLYLKVGWGYRLCFEVSQGHCSGFLVMCGARNYDQQLAEMLGWLPVRA